MSRIRLMSEVLSNQIAAGEVVERPGNVIKELLENAIDAKSTKIDVYVENGGLDYIQVDDNGVGMDKDDALLCFSRHGTSKIYSEEDLFSISTLGFRGEAIPAIASVSNFCLKTCDGDGPGTEIEYRFGKLINQKASNGRRGTSITVTELFFNTPARLKYLKASHVEFSAIEDMVAKLSLANSHIAFNLYHNRKSIFSTNGNNNLQEVIANIYGTNIAQNMVGIDFNDDDFIVNGFISRPQLTRSNKKYITILINNRVVRNNAISDSLKKGYQDMIASDRFPIAVINIDMDPLLIDVNVHPAKLEVRLSKEFQLVALIEKNIKQLLKTIDTTFDAKYFNDQKFQRTNPYEKKQTVSKEQKVVLHTAFDFDKQINNDFQNKEIVNDNDDFENNSFIDNKYQKNSYQDNLFNPIDVIENDDNDSNDNDFSDDELIETTNELESDETNLEQNIDLPVNDEVAQAPSFKYQVNNRDFYLDEIKETASEVLLSTPKISKKFYYVGQVHGTYLIAQNELGMYIIDQHAAQERINYEYYTKQFQKINQDMQEILIPLVFELPGSDYTIVEKNLDVLEQIGIKLETFGINTFVCKKIPGWLRNFDPQIYVQTMIDQIANQQKVDADKLIDFAIITLSCKSALKANDYQDAIAAQFLLDNLMECEQPYTCPHGRPTIVTYTNYELKKMFKRIVNNG